MHGRPPFAGILTPCGGFYNFGLDGIMQNNIFPMIFRKVFGGSISTATLIVSRLFRPAEGHIAQYLHIQQLR